MADHVIPGQNNSKIAVLWRKFTALFASKAIWFGLVLILIGLAMLAYTIFHKTPHEKSKEVARQASVQAENGSFNEAIQSLHEAYALESKTNLKAGLAYKLGIKYYQTGSSEEGKKWLEKSAELYKQAGDTESAEDATRQIATQEGAKKAADVNTQIYDNNASRRQNIQDDQL